MTNISRIQRLFLATGGLLLLTLTACSGLAGEPVIVATQPPSSAAGAIAAIGQTVTTSEVGSEIFAQRCVACHGITGKGDGDMVKGGAISNVPDLTDASKLTVKTPQDYFDTITNGRMDKMMPPWKDALTDKQRWAVTDYVYQLGHPGELAAVPSESAPSVATTDEAAVAAPATETPVSAITATINGTVSNGTAGAAVPPGLTATLHQIDANFAETTTEAAVAADGSFQFDGVEMLPEQTYLVTVSYQDEVFASSSITGELSQVTINLPVTIYELSDDPALAQIDTLFSQISLEGDRLLVIQLASFSVTGDRALRSVHLNVPEGATIENLSSSQRYTVSADGRQVIDSLTLVPGVPHTAHIGYSLPYNGDVTIAQPVDYALTKGFEIINDINGISIGGDGIQSLGGRSTGMSFGRSDVLLAGTTVQFNVSGFPAVETAASTTTTDTSTPTSHVLAYILIALGLVSIGLALLLAVRERVQPQPANAGTASDVSDPNSRVNVLVREIAALDVQHQAGKISDAAYEKRRYSLKAQLMALAKRAGTAQE